jgi:dihydroflavonol-4-reductase
MKNIFISGISGFIGTHITIEGIKRGYQITGTTRNQQKEDEVKKTIEKVLGVEALKSLKVFHCDLNSPDNWQEAMKGCDAILHVASPFPLGIPKHEDDVIMPARNGVKHVMDAALANNISRVVQTSSIAAILYGHEKGKINFDEADFTNLNSGVLVSAYAKSKTLAEQDMWQYAKENPSLKITVINPGFVLGPILNKEIGTSADIIVKMMKGKFPGTPKMGFPIADVRDVAAAHFNALENEISIGQRYAIVNESLWMKDVALAVLDACPEYKNKLKARELPNWLVKIASLFDKTIRMVKDELGLLYVVNNDKMKKDLKIAPISSVQAVQETAKSLVDLKLV